MTDQREALLRLPRYAHPKGTMIRLDDVRAALPSTPQPEGLDPTFVRSLLGRHHRDMRLSARHCPHCWNERARLAPPPPEPTPDTFWLVERGQPEGVNPPVYYATHASRTRWTPSAGLAVRFDSKADADLFIDHQLGGTPIVARAVEHGWVAPPPPEPDVERRISLTEEGINEQERRHRERAAPPPPDHVHTPTSKPGDLNAWCSTCGYFPLPLAAPPPPEPTE